MNFGMTIPNYGLLAEAKAIKAISHQAEELGFNLMAIADHLVIPKRWKAVYPYSATGKIDTFDSGECLDPLALMAALTLLTKRIRLVTAVLVVPYRPPILTAKQLATIDVLSNGRVIVGCGTGWMREEFEAIGAPPFEMRGKVTDEYIESFKAMWTNDEPTYSGAHVEVKDIYFRPQPIQKPHPPIWIGGDSMAALRRTAKYGDGWLPVGRAPNNPINTVARYQEASRILSDLAFQAGRDPNHISRTLWAVWYNEKKRVTLDDGGRHILTGSPEEIADDINALKSIGVSDVLFNFISDTLDETLRRTESFAERVMPLVYT